MNNPITDRDRKAANEINLRWPQIYDRLDIKQEMLAQAIANARPPEPAAAENPNDVGYGYMPIREWRERCECFNSNKWNLCDKERTGCTNLRRLKIEPGEGWEILPQNEVPPDMECEEFRIDGRDKSGGWRTLFKRGGQSVAEIVKASPQILAIRRRIAEPKVGCERCGGQGIERNKEFRQICPACPAGHRIGKAMLESAYDKWEFIARQVNSSAFPAESPAEKVGATSSKHDGETEEMSLGEVLRVELVKVMQGDDWSATDEQYERCVLAVLIEAKRRISMFSEWCASNQGTWNNYHPLKQQGVEVGYNAVLEQLGRGKV
jgi:hypothetical protein